MAEYKPIENYGIIGDLHTVALVASDGSMDWCCLPYFDSPSVFGALLDSKKGGRFKLAPPESTSQKQMYLPESCVLVTRFFTEKGMGEVLDFMTVESSSRQIHQVIRIARTVRGKMEFHLECTPAFDYARTKHKIRIDKRGAVFAAGKDRLGLTSDVRLQKQKQEVTAHFTLKEGQEKAFVLRYASSKDSGKILNPEYDVKKAFQDTCAFWRKWVSGISYEGRWREMVERSAMTLKLLTFLPTGAVIAAPTTSLPETAGGERNFDYRYSWIRDSAFTIYAFLKLGLTEEAKDFIHWIHECALGKSQRGKMQMMYGIHGKTNLKEKELRHLDGYRSSKPVRIGNLAHRQLQLDIYGELMDTVYLSNKYSEPISDAAWRQLSRFLDYVCDNWKKKDEGIWEVRGGRYDFVYSKVMCWVALDRGVRLMDKRSFPGNRKRWYETRNKIYDQIMSQGWNAKQKSFVQYYGTDALDASALIMPLVFFISPTDPKMKDTVRSIRKKLACDSLVQRYQRQHGAKDGFSGTEGFFSMCSFWLVECLTRQGHLEEARLLLEKMFSYSNHLGLYSEEIGASGEFLGNFPQALTHMSLISATVNLDRAIKNHET